LGQGTENVGRYHMTGQEMDRCRKNTNNAPIEWRKASREGMRSQNLGSPAPAKKSSSERHKKKKKECKNERKNKKNSIRVSERTEKRKKKDRHEGEEGTEGSLAAEQG